MGHVHIGFLPHTRQWNAIVDQLSPYDNDANALHYVIKSKEIDIGLLDGYKPVGML